MKRFSRLIPVLAILLSCTRLEPVRDLRTANGEYAFLKLSVSTARPVSKSGNKPQDTAIDNICILEFDAAGNAVYGSLLEFEPELTVPVLKDADLNIYAVANPTNDLLSVTSEEELIQMQSSLSSTDPSRLEMVGSITGRFSGGESAELRLGCICAMVQVDSLTIRLTSQPHHEYLSAAMRYAYLERTPVSCTYSLQPSIQFTNTYSEGIGAGIFNGAPGTVSKSFNGDTGTWEYRDSWSLYAMPNYSTDKDSRTVLALMFRALYVIDVHTSPNMEPEKQTQVSERTVHIYMPAVLPNTLYRIRHITVNGDNNKWIYLPASCDNPFREFGMTECEFEMENILTGEPMGVAKGEVVYE